MCFFGGIFIYVFDVASATFPRVSTLSLIDEINEKINLTSGRDLGQGIRDSR